MQRREFILLGGGAAAAIAGCTEDTEGNGNGNGNGGGSDPDTVEDGDEDTPTETGEPNFQINSVDAPDEVEINEEWSWSVTIGNTGDAAGTFESTVYASDLEANERVEVGTISEDIPAGGSTTYGSSSGSYPYMTRLRFELEGGTEIFTVQVLTKQLSFTDVYESPNRILATVQRVEFQDSYTWQGGSGSQYKEQPSSGNKWAFVYVYAENDSGSTEYLPFSRDFTMRVGNSQYDEALIYKDDGKYEGGEVGPGVVREGWVCFEIPESVSRSDLTIDWFDSTYEGEYGVRWSPS